MKQINKFKHLDKSDRDRIHALYGYGHNQKDIARVLEVNPGTISREIARSGRKTYWYNAKRAQDDANLKRSQSKRPGMKIAEDLKLKKYIIKELKHLRAPDEIAGYMKRHNLSPRVGTNAIYKWLYSSDGKKYCRYLCTRRSKKKTQSRLKKKELIPNRISFRYRPTLPEMVHAEGDLFVSPTSSHDKTNGLLIVVPEVYLLSGEIIPNKTKLVIVPAVKKIARKLTLDTCTFDNGIENVHHREFGVDSYFCDPGSPWQKPYVESSIGLIRRWFLPKGTMLSIITNQTFQSQLHLLNKKYRKSLGYRSAYEVSIERGILTRVPRISLETVN